MSKEAEKQGKPAAWYVDFGNDDEPNYVALGEKPNEPAATVRPLVFGDTTPQQRDSSATPLKPLTDEPTFVRMVDGVPCMTLTEHQHLVAQQRTWVGLTDDEIWKFWWNKPEVQDGEDDSMEAQFVAAVRAVLAAHGIKE